MKMSCYEETKYVSTLPPPCCHPKPPPFCCPKYGCPPVQQYPPPKCCCPSPCPPFICRQRPEPSKPPTLYVVDCLPPPGPKPIECCPPKQIPPNSCVRYCVLSTCGGCTYAPCYFTKIPTCICSPCC
ncbi:small proline-rich protein 2H-like [Ceratina calcarata]|uniref:Small proline-rich protein 2H-like n=1 Tax=Ceratina calcarata TaxID=156304 RepID=A0AAJ7S4D7_9HYME|nr:small proline-rich protein 2H-like [Ceratina calcarata]